MGGIGYSGIGYKTSGVKTVALASRRAPRTRSRPTRLSRQDSTPSPATSTSTSTGLPAKPSTARPEVHEVRPVEGRAGDGREDGYLPLKGAPREESVKVE